MAYGPSWFYCLNLVCSYLDKKIQNEAIPVHALGGHCTFITLFYPHVLCFLIFTCSNAVQLVMTQLQNFIINPPTQRLIFKTYDNLDILNICLEKLWDRCLKITSPLTVNWKKYVSDNF